MNTNAAARSSFVDVLAWILLVMNGFSILGALMQNVMVNVVMPDMMAATPRDLPDDFAMAMFRGMALLFLGMAIFTTYAAYALLKRRNWARRTFIVLFAVGIAFLVLWMAAFSIGFGFGGLPMPASAPAGMRTMMTLMIVFGCVFALALSCLFFWLIRRLRSQAVKAEFTT